MSASLKHRTLSSAIVERLRQTILDGTHAAGTQLRQDHLAENFGVSRIPVREALFQLESEGLVRIIPHKGAIVSGLSLDEINDVFDLRAMLEPRLLAWSAPMLDAADLEGLDEIQAIFRAAIAAREVATYGELNARFHTALYARANLPRSLLIVTGLLQTSDRYTRLQLSSREAMIRAESEHAELIALCRSRAFDEACALLKCHVETVRGDLVHLLGDRIAG